MKDLSGLEKQLFNLILNIKFNKADNNISLKNALHRRLYIRLVDKAIDEYQTSRQILTARVDEGESINIFKFIDHMENCISTVRRVLRYLDLVKGNQEGFHVPRLLRKQINTLTSSLVEVRNIIEHMDEKIQKNEIHEDMPVMIKLLDSNDGITIGGKSLKFEELARIITRLHELGKEFSAWNVENKGEVVKEGNPSELEKAIEKSYKDRTLVEDENGNLKMKGELSFWEITRIRLNKWWVFALLILAIVQVITMLITISK